MVLSAAVTSLLLDFFNLVKKKIYLFFFTTLSKTVSAKNRRSNFYSANTLTDKMKVENY